MKFRDLTEEQKFFIKKIHSESSLPWDRRMVILQEKFNKSERTIRRWIKKLGFSAPMESDSPQLSSALNKKAIRSNYYIISWAQNATPVHPLFFNNMLTYAEYIGAEVYIIAGRYKNPTSVFSDKNHDWWDESLTPYLTLNRLDLHDRLTVLGDIKIQPTAIDPLMGFEGITASRSTILGHPGLHLKTLPVLDGYPHKFLATTGAVTFPNYTDSKAGKTAEFHHALGFVVVEIKDSETVFFRQVNATADGDFCDLLTEVRGGIVTPLDYVEGFVMGDLHAANKDEELYKATLKYLKKLKPNQLVLHDIFDGESISHHERKDPIKNYFKFVSGKLSIKSEIDLTLDCIEDFLEYNPIVVNANHNRWIDRWIVDQDWKKEIHNGAEYIEYTHVLLKGLAPNGIIPYAIQQRFGDRVKCLTENDSYRIGDWEIAHHGDRGSNGSKGNITQFSKLSTKVIVGDWHTANRRFGAISVGTHSKLRVSFNKGASSWVHADAIIHKNEKAQLIIYINNEFTTLL